MSVSIYSKVYHISPICTNHRARRHEYGRRHVQFEWKINIIMNADDFVGGALSETRIYGDDNYGTGSIVAGFSYCFDEDHPGRDQIAS